MHLLSWRRLFLYSRRQKRPEAALIHQGHQIACSILSWDADMLFWQLFTPQTPNTSLFPKRPHYSTLYWWCHAAGGQRTDMNKHPKCDRDAMRIPRPDISIRTLGSGIMNMCCFFFFFLFSAKCMTMCLPSSTAKKPQCFASLRGFEGYIDFRYGVPNHFLGDLKAPSSGAGDIALVAECLPSIHKAANTTQTRQSGTCLQ